MSDPNLAQMLPQPTRRRRWPWIAAAAVVVAALVVAGFLAFRPSEADGAVGACEDAVRERLKSPTTAEFAGTTAKQWGADRQYHVTGEVSAQNGFGAMLTTSFNCTVRHLEDGRWQVRSAIVN